MQYFPISLDMNGRQCIVIGGGRVAARKIKSLLACGGKVTVISPDLTPELEELSLAGTLSWKKNSFQEGDLNGAFLVIAATDDPDVQKKVHEEAEHHNIMLNVADVPERCSFILPATVRRGDLTVSVSTAGKSPALAKKLRQALEKQFGHEYAVCLNIMGTLRPVVLGCNRSQKENEALFERILDSDMLAWIREKNWERMSGHIREILQSEGIDPGCLDTIEECFPEGL